VDPTLHKRYLDYRDLHVYFGGKKPRLTPVEFAAADAAYAALRDKGDARDDEEDARFQELTALLHRD
jgi:hypothetical protein